MNDSIVITALITVFVAVAFSSSRILEGRVRGSLNENKNEAESETMVYLLPEGQRTLQDRSGMAAIEQAVEAQEYGDSRRDRSGREKAGRDRQKEQDKPESRHRLHATAKRGELM
ncbi:unnamed protein product [Xylocopa violacea]|uniref:Uncharacterized protein n=1 Tax=Xylocopa violacea TaxID=135666 RepID=A0ABP1NUY1_XYLVO